MTESTEITASERLTHELTVASDASIGVIAVRCPETEVYRVVDELYVLAMSQETEFRMHTAEGGWQSFERIRPEDTRAAPFDPLKPQESSRTTANVGAAFEAMHDGNLPDIGYFVMLDLYFTFADMQTQTCIRKQAQRSLSNGQRLFLVVPNHAEIPDAIAPLMHVVEFGLPTRSELSDDLKNILEALEDEDRPDLSDDDHDAIVSNGQGMTAGAFEAALALAMTSYGVTHETMEGFSAEHIIESLRSYKTQLLRKTNVLELQPPVDESQIGGLDLFKEWMHQRKLTYTDHAKQYGVSPSRGALVVGPPGCKAEGTIIHYKRGRRNSGRPMRIEEFVAKFNREPVPRSRPWATDRLTYVQSWDAETGQIFYNQVIGAYRTGVKSVVDVVLDTGQAIGITPEDSLLSADGTFVKAGDLRVGDTVLIRGSMKPMAQGGRNVNRPRAVVDVRYYDDGWPHEVRHENGIFVYKRQHRARLVIEARMNGISYEDYVHNLKNVPDHPYRRTLSKAFEVHHLDEDPLNDSIENLQVLSKAQHLEQHREQSIANLNVEHTRTAKIVSVGYGREVATYDLQLASPCENFVCENSFITHNTGKSLVAKAAGSILNLPVIRFDVGRVFGAYVGQSEGAMRTVLKMLDAMAPCVLMLDEIDKGFAGMGASGGGDHGTTQRVFGTFLTWMQERDQEHNPVFLIMTANRVQGLPPELLRKGRIDETWSVNVPNDDEREAIIRIHVEKRGQSIAKGDLAAAVRITANLVGAEIEAMVEDALVLSLANPEPGITIDLLERAKETLKPMHITRATEFEAMKEWAASNARPASSPMQSSKPSKTPKPVRGIKRGRTRRAKVERE